MANTRSDHSAVKTMTTLRLVNSLRDRLEKDADRNGRPLSSEIEIRLLASVQQDDIEGHTPAGPRTMRLFRRLQAVISLIEAATGESWGDDGATSAAVRIALNQLIDIDMPKDPAWVEASEALRANPDDKEAEATFTAIDQRHTNIAMRALNAVIQTPTRHPGHVNPDGSVTPIAGPRHMGGN